MLIIIYLMRHCQNIISPRNQYFQMIEMFYSVPVFEMQCRHLQHSGYLSALSGHGWPGATELGSTGLEAPTALEPSEPRFWAHASKWRGHW